MHVYQIKSTEYENTMNIHEVIEPERPEKQDTQPMGSLWKYYGGIQLKVLKAKIHKNNSSCKQEEESYLCYLEIFASGQTSWCNLLLLIPILLLQCSRYRIFRWNTLSEHTH